MRIIEQVLFVVCVLLAFKLILFDKAYPSIPKRFTKIEINNPYSSVSIKAEVKCDWNNKLNDFVYRRIIRIQRKSKVVIEVPSYFRKCQIWPTKVKLFGRVK